MSYTVNKLAKLSGLSVRTLRFYDEIGLLKPAFYGDNKYRYYEEEQLLLLQQILFFREVGMPLNGIQKIMSSHDFDKIEALQSHKKTLLNNLEQTQTMLKTIDKTIAHLKGKEKIQEDEIYAGLDPKKQKEYEKYLIDSGKVTQQLLEQGKESVKNWTKNDWEKFHLECEEINKAFVIFIEKNIQPSASEVQNIVRRHYEWVKLCWTPTRDSYIGLSQLYREHSDFREYYGKYHPQLVEYLIESMRIFAKQELS